MKIIHYMLAAIVAYLVAGWNPAITFSKLIYKKDIRTEGSKNPGFTNFKRCFGGKWAYLVLVLDLSKAAILEIVFGGGAFGIAFTGLFAMVGHAYPIWYGFKGGKGFLVCLSTAWVMDWRVGLVSTIVMIVLLFTTKYMSLATIIAMVVSPFMMFFWGIPISAVLLYSASVIFMVVRHRENLKRLRMGTETKFTFKN